MLRPWVKRYNVQITVKSVTKGECPQGNKPGDTWLVKNKTPDGVCLAAFGVLYSTLSLLQFGGERPYDEDGDVVLVPCPDMKHYVIYELRRLRES
ncbi:TIGR04076 family protein [Chloroflexota bacterium]